MSARQELQMMLGLMPDDDVAYVLSLVKDNFALRRKGANWENIEEVDSDEGDFALLEKISSQRDGYGEYVTQDDLMKRLGLR